MTVGIAETQLTSVNNSGAFCTDCFLARLLPYADLIVSLTEDGHVAQQGTFAELSMQDGYVRSMLGETLSTENAQEDDEPKGVTQEETMSRHDRPNPDRLNHLQETIDSPKVATLQLYRYYVQALGWKASTVFALIAIAYTTLVRFPGQFLFDSSICGQRVTNLLPQISG